MHTALFKDCFKLQNYCISDHFFCQILLFLQKPIMPKFFQISTCSKFGKVSVPSLPPIPFSFHK